MHKEEELYHCRVCGLKQDEKPWGDDDNTPSFDYCPCCHVEFGYQDCLIEGVRDYRDNWLKKGGTWFYPKEKPDDWSLEEQLEQIPQKYNNPR